MDAVCRIVGASFWTAMRSNLAGMAEHPLIPDLGAFDFTTFLAELEPVRSIAARHTVGLVDPIVAADRPSGSRVDDGLPETLEEVIAAYGHRCFKLKVGGDRQADLARLVKIAGVLDKVGEGLHVTLDGNEQFENVDAVGRPLGGDGGRAGAAEALRRHPVHRAADQAPGGPGAQRRRAGAAPGR